MSTNQRWTFEPPAEPYDLDFAPEPQPEQTACKHGLDECERCGTTNSRDRRHSTRGGLGTVARLAAGQEPDK